MQKEQLVGWNGNLGVKLGRALTRRGRLFLLGILGQLVKTSVAVPSSPQAARRPLTAYRGHTGRTRQMPQYSQPLLRLD